MMSNYKCSKCNNELEEIGIPPQIQFLQGHRNVMNIGEQVPEEIKNDPFLYKGLYCPSCNKAFCPPCAKTQSQICPECRQSNLMPAYRPLLNKIESGSRTSINRSSLPSAPSLGNTMTDVFASPSEVFESLKNTAPSPILWIMPLIATLLIVVVSVIMLFTNESLRAEMKDIQSKAIQKMVDEGKLSQDQAEKAESQAESMGGIMIAIGIVGGAIFVAAFYFGGALFLWLANKTILKSAVGYGKHLELYGIASWIGVLGGIITVLMMVGLGSMAATPSGALALLGSFDPTNKLHMLFASLNIFSIWQTAAIGIGLSKFSEKQIGAGIGVAFALWIVWVALSILLGIAR